MKTTILTAAALVAAAPAVAQMAHDGDFKAMGTAQTEVTELSANHMVMNTGATYESFDVPGDHPLAGAKGKCFGAAEVLGAEAMGGGNCVFDTAAGDKAVLHWDAAGMSPDGALTGEWSVTGGTGAWAGAKGGGTFSSLTDPDTGAFVNTVSGEIVLK